MWLAGCITYQLQIIKLKPGFRHSRFPQGLPVIVYILFICLFFPAYFFQTDRHDMNACQNFLSKVWRVHSLDLKYLITADVGITFHQITPLIFSPADRFWSEFDSVMILVLFCCRVGCCITFLNYIWRSIWYRKTPLWCICK